MNPGKIRLDISGPIAIILLNGESLTITVSLGSSAQAGFFIFISDHVALEPAGVSSGWRKRPSGLRPSGLRPSGLRPSGLRPSGLRPSGLRPPGLAGDLYLRG